MWGNYGVFIYLVFYLSPLYAKDATLKLLRPLFYPRSGTKLHIKGFVQCFIEILPVRAKESVYTEVRKQ